MSGYNNFAVIGAAGRIGRIGNFIIRQLIDDKAKGTINQVVVLTRKVSLRLLVKHLF